MSIGRAHACSTFFTDADGIEYLFACGGDLNGSVEVYNFSKNKWSDVANTNVSRECAGIFYDAFDDIVSVYNLFILQYKFPLIRHHYFILCCIVYVKLFCVL